MARQLPAKRDSRTVRRAPRPANADSGPVVWFLALVLVLAFLLVA